MVILDVFYVALATMVVMLVLQVITFLVTRMMYPPQQQIVYRTVEVPAQQQAPPPPAAAPPPPPPQQQPVFTQPAQDIQLPEYEPRKPASDGLRLDAILPDGIQETRPPGL